MLSGFIRALIDAGPGTPTAQNVRRLILARTAQIFEAMGEQGRVDILHRLLSSPHDPNKSAEDRNGRSI
jgi:hypothetical protein